MTRVDSEAAAWARFLEICNTAKTWTEFETLIGAEYAGQVDEPAAEPFAHALRVLKDKNRDGVSRELFDELVAAIRRMATDDPEAEKRLPEIEALA